MESDKNYTSTVFDFCLFDQNADVYTTDVVEIRDFGKKDPGEGDAYDSDEEKGGGRPGGVQCQQG